MSTGATIALVAGGVAVAGVAFLVLRKPALAPATAAPAKKPATGTPSAGSLIASLGGAIVSRLGGDALDALEGKFQDWIA